MDCIMHFSDFFWNWNTEVLYNSWSGINLHGGHYLTFAVCFLSKSFPSNLYFQMSACISLCCSHYLCIWNAWDRKGKWLCGPALYFLQHLSLWQVNQKPCVKPSLSSALHPSQVFKDLQSGNPITLSLQVSHRCVCFTFCLVICTRSCLTCFVGIRQDYYTSQNPASF